MNVEAYGETHKETKNMLTHLICDLCFRFNVFQIHVNSDMVVSLFHRQCTINVKNFGTTKCENRIKYAITVS